MLTFVYSLSLFDQNTLNIYFAADRFAAKKKKKTIFLGLLWGNARGRPLRYGTVHMHDQRGKKGKTGTFFTIRCIAHLGVKN